MPATSSAGSRTIRSTTRPADPPGASIRVGGFGVTATRLSYAGELGWELTVEPANAVEVWDRAGRRSAKEHGIEPIGYRALESLRLEKGYRYFGAELTPRETPFEAGLDRFIRLDKGEFVGRDALLALRAAEPDGPARRLRTVIIGGADWAPIYGGEAVRIDGEVVGPAAERRVRLHGRPNGRDDLLARRTLPKARRSRSTSSPTGSPARWPRTSSSIPTGDEDAWMTMDPINHALGHQR